MRIPFKTFPKLKPLFLKRTFFNELLSMIALCFVLCFSFSIIYTQKLMRMSEDTNASINVAYLDALVDNADFMLENDLHLTMSALGKARSILFEAYSTPTSGNQTNSARVKIDLATAVESTSLIDMAFIHFPNLGTVITSSYSAGALSDSPYQKLIANYENNLIQRSDLKYENESSSVFRYEDRQVLAQDLFIIDGKKLATIYFIINTNEFYKHMTNSLDKNVHLAVYDAGYKPVFVKETAKMPGISEDIVRKLENAASRFIRSGSNSFYYGVSNRVQWRFVLSYDDMALISSARQNIIWTLLPTMVIIFLLSCGGALLLSLYLYKPFQKLLKNIDNRHLLSNPESIKGSEFDYLNETITEISDRQSELKAMMQNVARDVTSRLFFELISGSHIDNATVSEILAQTGSPFKLNALYVSCLLQLEPDPSQRIRQRQPLLTLLGKAMEAFDDKWQTISHVLAIDSQSFAVILSFDDRVSVFEGKKIVLSLEHSLIKLLEAHHSTATMAAGHLYHSILDVGFSFHEARKALPDQDALLETVEEQDSTKDSIDYSARAIQIIERIQEADVESALSLAKRVLDGILAAEANLESHAAGCRRFLNALMDQMATLEFVNLSTMPSDSGQLLQNLNQCANAEELAAVAEQVGNRFIRDFSNLLKKQKNPYIIAAIEFIRLNFQDMSLSLGSVAEATDISASYLSKLFKDNLGVLFTDYLNKYRISRSLELLTATDKSNAAIATETGFNSVQNFIRVFKKYMDVSPGKYREQNRPSHAGHANAMAVKPMQAGAGSV